MTDTPKFRAYHIAEKKYCEVMAISFYEESVLLGSHYDCEWYSLLEVNLEQYTGLKDKNGVEIFENDIVKKGSLVGYVSFLPQQNGYSVITKNSDYRLEYGLGSKIGKIHENSDMLKGDK